MIGIGQALTVWAFNYLVVMRTVTMRNQRHREMQRSEWRNLGKAEAGRVVQG